ncbi:hypothetical protein MIND_00160500 [Mycena indigotica]|uniref:Uncharacterized protein n=1 Tax=Mycena indigotica TaxID=2126181 RepID=A0A8H6TGN9_9AGAR|nr:uncharacterized protein MIND_00160500 [Mycena indigotica]KAF7316417.1 hypothetical protein MIND_00160500 [Mycena indigotica]
MLTQLYGVVEQTEHSKLFAHVKHNQHLCLSFDFTSLDETDSLAISSSISSIVDISLQLFVRNYSAQLNIAKGHQLSDDTGEMFQEVLVHPRPQFWFTVARDCRHFDAPFFKPPPPKRRVINEFGNLAFNGFEFRNVVPPSSHEVSQAMDIHLWEPLIANRRTIQKLVLSGCTLVQHSLIHRLGLTIPPQLVSACGFTIGEAQMFAESLLEDLDQGDIDDMQASCGRYSFSDAPSEPLLHPQKVISWVQRFSRPDNEDASQDMCFKLLSSILRMLPSESDDFEGLSLVDVMSLVAAGHVVPPPQTAYFVGDDTTRPTWQAFIGAGALERDSQHPQTLRLSNCPGVIPVLHSYLDDAVTERYDPTRRLFFYWEDLCSHKPNMLLRLLERMMRDLGKRCLLQNSELNLHGVFELLWRNAVDLQSEEDRPEKPFVYHPYTATPTIIEIPAFGGQETVSVELVTLTLAGLWRGANPKNDHQEPTRDELQKLFDIVQDEDETTLLARQYTVWSSTLNAVETNFVESFMRKEPSHVQLVAVGGSHVLYRGPREQHEANDACVNCGHCEEKPLDLPDEVMFGKWE